MPDESSRIAIRNWLFVLFGLVMMMVAIGGITRLTGSGLSIVEWRPVTGALPPIGEQAWQQAFDAYKSSPQFREVNHWMALEDFKRIFFWEYVHRLFGRMLGLVCFFPWLYFVLRKRMNRALALRTGSVLLLGGLQGVVGWYMVKSGLAQEPRVSHFRLATHLLLGVGCGQWILWLALDQSSKRIAAAELALSRAQRALAFGLLPLLALQLMYGAFMAGTHAGYLYATFPDMNGHYAPNSFFTGNSIVHDLVNNPMAIHYVHRVLALLVLVYVGVLAWRLRTVPQLAFAVRVLLAALTLQLLLGALTVVLHMPIVIAVAHQLGAYVLISSALLLCHKIFGSAEAHHAREVGDRDGGLAGSGQDLRRA